MPSTVLRAAAVTVATAIAAVSLAPAAQADTRTFDDGGKYLTTVKVTNGSSNVTVDAKVGTLTIGSYFTFWLDTDATNAGPEYKTTVYPNSDGIALRRVGSFASKGTVVRCADFRAKADAFGNDHVVITVPRSCIGKPAKVRVSVRGYFDVAGPNVVDWAPSYRHFFGWVAR